MSLFFKEYPSITAIHRKELEYLEGNPILEEKWIVTEKIHGSNFSFITDGKVIKAGRRKDILHDNDMKHFHNCGTLIAKYAEDIEQLWIRIKKSHPGALQMNIYGELFGPGVQKSTNYSQTLDFAAFDICYFEDLSVNPDRVTFIGIDEFYRLFAASRMPCARILFEGNYAECVEWSALNRELPTTIYPGSGNHYTREGHVIRPHIYRKFPNGSTIIIKDKSEKHKEISKPKKISDKSKLSGELEAARDEVAAYVTLARLANVKSKELTNADFGKLLEKFARDVLEDYAAQSEIFVALSDKDKKVIRKYVTQKAAELMKQV